MAQGVTREPNQTGAAQAAPVPIIAIYSPAARAILRGTLSAVVLADVPLSPSDSLEGDGDGPERAFVAIERGDGAPRRILLFRSLGATFDLFYAVSLDGQVLVSDRLDMMRARLPGCALDPESLLDHLLFRAPVGAATHLAGVRRVGHGEKVEIDLASGAVRRTQARRLALGSAALSAREVLDAVAAIVGETLAGARPEAVLFSGGVDSSLLASSLPGAPLVHGAVDSPEYAPEIARADIAAEALGRSVDRRWLAEVDIAEAVVAVTRRLGAPINHAATLLFDLALGSGHRRFAVGADADVTFGMVDPWAATFGPRATGAAMRALLRLCARTLPRRAGAALERIAAAGAAFSRPLGAADGFGLGVKTPVNAARLRRAVGDAAVDRRLLARWDYLAGLGLSFDPDARDPSDHLALKHIVGFFCNDTVAVWRQAATAQGVELVSPFSDARLLALSLAAPRGLRLVGGLEAKPLLKALLRKRAPAYPVRARKLGGVLPIGRYLAENRLAQLLEAHPLSVQVEGLSRAPTDPAEATLLWNALGYAVWRDLGGLAPSLERIDAFALSPAGPKSAGIDP